MAAVDVFNGSQLLVQIETSAGSGTWTHDCLINTERGIQFSADVVSATVPDCDDQDAPAWKVTEKDGLSATISGAGKMHASSALAWDTWFRSADTKSIKVKINQASGVTWTGNFHLTDFQVNGDRKEKANVSVTLVSDGAVTCAANS